MWLRPRVCSGLQEVLSIGQSRDHGKGLRAECKARAVLVSRCLAPLCLKRPLKSSKLFTDWGTLWAHLPLAFYPCLPLQSKWALLSWDCKVSFECTCQGWAGARLQKCEERTLVCVGEGWVRGSWAIFSRQDFPMLINPMSDFPWPRDNVFPQQCCPCIPCGRGEFAPISSRSSVLPFLGWGHGRNKPGCKCCWVEVAPCAFIFSYLHSNVSTQVHQCVIICTFSVLDGVLQKYASTHSSASHLQARLCFPLRVVRNTTNFRY